AKEGDFSLNLGGRRLSASNLFLYFVGLGLGTVAILYGFTRLFPGYVNGFVPEHSTLLATRPASPALGIPLVLVGLGLAVAAGWKFGRADTPSDESKEAGRARRHEDLMLGGIGVAASIVVALVGRDLAVKADASDIVGQARLI